ncbi:unnamed protein product [Sympodiomycopsis kandeliae]
MSSPSSRTSVKNAHIKISGDRTVAQPQFRILSQAVRCFILPDKLTREEVQKLQDEVIGMGALTAEIDYTNLILTDLRAPKRIISALKREQKLLVSDEWIARIPILHIDWLRDSATKKIMQDYEPYRVIPEVKQEGRAEAFDIKANDAMAAKRERSPTGNDRGSSGSEREDDGYTTPTPSRKRVKAEQRNETHSNAPAFISVSAKDAPLWQNSEYCCQRPTPFLSVHNQDLVNELEVIRKQRALTSQQWSERSYSGCLSAIKAYPNPICSENLKTIRNLKGVGRKMIGLIEQFCSNGHIVEAQQIRSDPANDILFAFMELYGVGPVSARSLYEMGCRTFKDVIAKGKSLATQLKVEDCYRILPDLQTKIPRVEVEEIARLIHAEIETFCPGSFYEICGGYRRGKMQSNDVDIVISNSRSEPFIKERLAVINRLLVLLKRKGLMSYSVNIMGGGASENFQSATRGHLDIAEIVFLPPKSALITTPRHRRIDLVFCSPRIYGAAVLGWTGSRNFEKDIRRFARLKGYKLDSSGIVTLEDEQLVDTREEKDVFKLLGLAWMPPELRNCDA